MKSNGTTTSSCRGLTATIAGAALTVMGLLAASPASASAAPGPALTVAPEALAEALVCQDAQPSATPRDGAVLLVHGTAVTPALAWGPTHVPALTAAGYNTCTVALPERALVDAQVSAEYVVNAIRAIDDRYAGDVDVVGHSQGAIVARWAIKFWPDIGERVDDYISLAGSNHGTVTTVLSCSNACADAQTQQATDSRFLAALNARTETPAGPDYSSIYSFTDEIVITSRFDPSPALDGARNVAVQDVCAARPVTHIGILTDAVSYALLRDALDNDGPVEPARVDRRVCGRAVAADFDRHAATRVFLDNYRAAFTQLSSEGDNIEPPLRDYARAALDDDANS